MKWLKRIFIIMAAIVLSLSLSRVSALEPEEEPSAKENTETAVPNAETYANAVYQDGELIFFQSNTKYEDGAENVSCRDIYGNTYYGTTFSGFAEDSNPPSWITNSSVREGIERAYVASGSVIAPISMRGWFDECRNLTIFSGDGFDTSNVTDMSYLFYACTKLDTVTLSNFNTSKVQDMSYMFTYCKKLAALDLSNFNTAACTNMEYMFFACSELTMLSVSNFNTAKVTSMDLMFANCEKLLSLNVTSFRGDSLESMESMFSYCSELTSLNVGNFNLPVLKSAKEAFYWCYNLTSLNLSKLNSPYLENTKEMFYGCSGLTSINLSAIKTSSLKNMEGMFYGCRELTAIDVSGWNTSSVENMGSVFRDCYKLSSIDVTGWDTSNVTDMSWLFEDCFNLTELDVRNFNTSKVTDMSYMFDGCTKLTSLDISNFDTSKVRKFNSMFGDLKMETIDVSHMNTSSAESMNGMFYNCQNMKTVDLSNFDFTNVDDMSYFFYECKSLEEVDFSMFNSQKLDCMYCMFAYCESLKEADLTAFDTSKVYNMAHMFAGCTSLEVLDLSSFDTHSVTSMPDMFAYCTRLDTITLGKGFTVWKDEAYLPEGYWTNGTLTKTNEQLYEDFPGNAEEYAGTWYLPMYPYKVIRCKADPIPEQYYTGTYIEPEIHLTYLGTPMTKGVDYLVSYSDNIAIGTATVTVTGIGDYAGEKILHFRIVDGKPFITEHPADKTAASGTQVSFKIKADRADTYQWYYRTSSSAEWKKSTAACASTDTYTLTSSQVNMARNGYQYRCEVKNAYGTAMSNPATLTVKQKPVITAQPKSQTVKPGTAVDFKVAASGEGLKYQWYYRTSASGTWSKSTAACATTDTYSLTSAQVVKARNGYQYKCVVSNEAGSATSNAATLTVSSPGLPVITAQPQSKTAVSGTAVSFKITASGEGLKYQWYYRTSASGTWSKSTASCATTDTYSLTASQVVSARNGYQYKCVVTNSAGSVTSNPATLTVISKPVITSQPSNKTVSAGTAVSFKVTASGTNLKYQWYYRTSAAGTWKKSTAACATTATYSLTASQVVKARSGYQYYCEVSNEAGSVSSNIVTLTVK
ncbi:MAG: BspA family leucine-rich repeat surface protein [Erysipelotrichales bacterium]|nr:BspA family leucine-rich repeat surface protein [Erysipelotrichales bacterium]